MGAKRLAVRKKKKFSPLSIGLKQVMRGATLAAGGWMLYSHFGIDHDWPLPEAIAAERKPFYSATGGRVSYYSDTRGSDRPLVLIHSINAAASAYEMRPLFEHYRGQRPVYALDLPGYGFSERTDRVYSPELFEGAILSFLSGILNEPADVIALSLGSEFAARAALAQPGRIHSLVLISPSGLKSQELAEGDPSPDRSKAKHFAYTALSFPLWGQPIFDLLATRASIQYYLQKSFIGPVDSGLADYSESTAHQPGAHHAPLYFLSGQLFTSDVRQKVYENLQVPSLVIYDRDPYVTFDALPLLLSKNRNWCAERISPTLGLPQFEKLPETVTAIDRFWASSPT